MYEAYLKTGWDSLLFAVPCVALLLFGFFHLDESVAAPKRAAVHRRAACGQDEEGRGILTDPDGRRWEKVRSK